jgi:hypothetical protein
VRSGRVAAEVTTDRALSYPRVLDELIPSALHTVEQWDGGVRAHPLSAARRSRAPQDSGWLASLRRATAGPERRPSNRPCGDAAWQVLLSGTFIAAPGRRLRRRPSGQAQGNPQHSSATRAVRPPGYPHGPDLISTASATPAPGKSAPSSRTEAALAQQFPRARLPPRRAWCPEPSRMFQHPRVIAPRPGYCNYQSLATPQPTLSSSRRTRNYPEIRMKNAHCRLPVMARLWAGGTFYSISS